MAGDSGLLGLVIAPFYQEYRCCSPVVAPLSDRLRQRTLGHDSGVVPRLVKRVLVALWQPASELFHSVTIGTTEDHCQGQSLAIGESVTFATRLAAVGGFWLQSLEPHPPVCVCLTGL